MDNNQIKELLTEHKGVLERFIYYKMPSKADGDDMIQNVYVTILEKIDTLKDVGSFKPWVLKIAANKCNDFYRKRMKEVEIPTDEIETKLTKNTYGITVQEIVRETLGLLSANDKQILDLFYFENNKQAQIAKKLNIPVGTVKSRLYTARQNFINNYPYPPIMKGVKNMKKLPEFIPEYEITKSDKIPFEVKWEEAFGWFIIPKIGEEIIWGSYDFPKRKIFECVKMRVIGKAKVHGIEGVEITSNIIYPNEKNDDRTFVIHLTETHCRYLSECHYDGDVKQYNTFLDDGFLSDWGMGGDNSGKEIMVKAKGLIRFKDNVVICPENRSEIIDVIGRYNVKILNKSYDTVRIMYINSRIMTENYIDEHGKTVLWRRFNIDDWAYKHYKQKWSEKLPQNERIIINSATFVHWYDCITDYII